MITINWRVVSADQEAQQLTIEYTCDGVPPMTLNCPAEKGDVDWIANAYAPRQHFWKLLNPAKKVDVAQFVHAVGKVDVVSPTHPMGPAPRILTVAYHFAKGETLAEHAHERDALHDIKLISGHVIVHKESGDVDALPGEVVNVKVGEKHSIEALEPSVTHHTLINP